LPLREMKGRGRSGPDGYKVVYQTGGRLSLHSWIDKRFKGIPADCPQFWENARNLYLDIILKIREKKKQKTIANALNPNLQSSV
jgi:hypothetical protein